MPSKKSAQSEESSSKASKPAFELPDFQCPELTLKATAKGEIAKGDEARTSESSSHKGCKASKASFRGATNQGNIPLGKYLCECGMPFRARMN
tara:strand:+ start:1452 stop:1730 length:279 start_codon:yes stop_codon:yes gene_type:complete